MFYFKTKTTVHILLLTSQCLHVYSWQQDTLSPIANFTSDELGLAEFDRYLDSLHVIPVYLVADCIEEDFRIEPVAHVLGKDRKILLERKLLQYFRTTEYRSARIQDREESGRRDDKVLFSALTNTDQINVWVDRLLAHKMQIKGLLSAPLLMESFTEFLHLEQIPHLLLVNLDPQSGLRQTYLQNKHLKFSRLLSLTTIQPGSLAETLRAECSHTRQYLERLKLLSRDHPLEVHIHIQDGLGEELGKKLRDTPLLHFHLHETGMVAAELGIDPALTGDQGAVFLCLVQALRAQKLVNAYAPAPIIRYHRLHQTRRGLIAGTSLLVAVALLAGISLLLDGFDTRTTQRNLDQEVRMLDSRFQQLHQNFPVPPVPAEAMQNLVESVERTRQQAASPLQMMTRISRAVALCPDIRLQQLGWQMSGQTQTTNVPTMGGVLETMGGRKGKVAVPALLPDLLAGKAGLVVTLNGMVYPSVGYGEAQNRVISFIAALEQIPGLKVTPVAMPTETKPDATVKATLDGKTILAEFSLKLDYQAKP